MTVGREISSYKAMSKEKAVENIKEALKYTAKTSLIGTSPAEVASAVSWAEVLLLRALKELEG